MSRQSRGGSKGSNSAMRIHSTGVMVLSTLALGVAVPHVSATGEAGMADTPTTGHVRLYAPEDGGTPRDSKRIVATSPTEFRIRSLLLRRTK